MGLDSWLLFFQISVFLTWLRVITQKQNIISASHRQATAVTQLLFLRIIDLGLKLFTIFYSNSDLNYLKVDVTEWYWNKSPVQFKLRSRNINKKSIYLWDNVLTVFINGKANLLFNVVFHAVRDNHQIITECRLQADIYCSHRCASVSVLLLFIAAVCTLWWGVSTQPHHFLFC